MNLGVLTWNPNAFCSGQLIRAATARGLNPVALNFNQLTARVSYRPYVSIRGDDMLEKLDALIVRPIGRGSLEEIIFRMDLLRRLERKGLTIVNPPEAIERSVDKYHALALLEEAGIPVPKTVVTENSLEAMKAFHELGGDVVLKPLFGSRGLGIMRISSPDEAARTFRNLAFQHNVLYLQEFIPHGNYDYRALILDGSVLASERRVAINWKTNISQGASPEFVKLKGEAEELAIKAAEVIGCKIAGVDIMESRDGVKVIELNSQPGWTGLQMVAPINIAEAIVDYIIKTI